MGVLLSIINKTEQMKGIEGECVKAEREVANAADKNAIVWRF